MSHQSSITRRDACRSLAGSGLGIIAASCARGDEKDSKEDDAFHLNYILASPMYGKMPLEEVLNEVRKVGARHIDIWPLPHANHREQVDGMGLDQFARRLQERGVELGAITRYDLGPYRLQDELPVAKQLGAKLIVCGAPKYRGGPIKDEVRDLIDSLTPTITLLEKHDIVLGLENHAGWVTESPEALRWFAEFCPSPHVGIALAPYHLPQESETIAKLIRDLDSRLVFFQAWEHGQGCHKKLPKEQEMLQMPGRGSLDFQPILAALKQIDYQGWTEIFMHPVPRGIPILDSAAEVTLAINQSRNYLDNLLRNI